MAAPDALLLDTSRWPLAVVHFPSRPVTDAEIESFVEAQRVMLRRRERYVEIVDARRAHMINAAQRKRMGEFLEEVDEAGKRLCAGVGLVIESAVARGGLTAILWVFQPTFPMKVVGTPEEAMDYVTSAATAAGIVLPKGARESVLRGSLSRSA